MLKELLQACDYDLDKLTQHWPKKLTKGIEKNTKEVINKGIKDTIIVINKRKRLLLNRIHDRLYTGSY